MDKRRYHRELKKLQTELCYLQSWVVQQGLKVVVLFEGRDASGKGGAIKAITARLNPRIVSVVALPKPSDVEKSQWYFQRYVPHLPSAGQIVLLDRSWYNRAGVEKVMGFCTEREYQEFLLTCPQFEQMLSRDGVILIKYWFSVSDEEQEKRFNARLTNPLKRWKFSEMDLASRTKWADYSRAKDAMFAHTDTRDNPWYVVDGDNKLSARLNCIADLLDKIPYQRIDPPPLTLPPINHEDYQRPAKSSQNHVKQRY